MKKRTTKWFIYRMNPFVVLHDGGAGFLEPRFARERGMHIWYFLDRSLVRRLVRELNQTSPTSYAEASLLKREGRPTERRQEPNTLMNRTRRVQPATRANSNSTIDDLD